MQRVILTVLCIYGRMTLNVTEFYKFLERIVSIESRFNIQKHLKNVSGCLGNLADSPQDTNLQQKLHDSAGNLSRALDESAKLLNHADRMRIERFSELSLFLPSMSNLISETIVENPMSPAVARDFVADLFSRRAYFLGLADGLFTQLKQIGIDHELEHDEDAEVAFQIPRKIFHNNLDGLISELRELRFIVQTFTEIETGTVEEIKIGQISTSDPIIFFWRMCSGSIGIRANR